MSFLQRLWQRIRRPRGFIGRDFEGNNYFEYPNPNDGMFWGRPKRVVRYRKGYDMWTYVAGEKRLPVQWTSWLSHTRVYPPSLEELAADLQRQKRVRLNAALIEARDQEERLRVAAASFPTSTGVSTSQPQPQPTVSSASDDQQAENRAQGLGAGPIVPKGSAIPSFGQLQWPSKPSPSDEPQAWTPRAVQRGA